METYEEKLKLAELQLDMAKKGLDVIIRDYAMSIDPKVDFCSFVKPYIKAIDELENWVFFYKGECEKEKENAKAND